MYKSNMIAQTIALTASTLLEDGVRVITRRLYRGKELSSKPSYKFSDHTRVIKNRVLTILSARGHDDVDLRMMLKHVRVKFEIGRVALFNGYI